MTEAIREIRRVLKPGGWLNLVFHNSSSVVWRSIQEALWDAGFSIETIQTLDKKHGTFEQFSSDNAVGYDLIIHCKKQAHANHALTATKISAEEMRAFIVQAIRERPDAYTIRYLHVKREDEVDCRKLYSFWLKKRMEAEEIVDVGYEEFRRAAMDVLGRNFQ
jgi:ubiquinone/menaquinone biosynthesis C-methylase UbiE